MDARILKAVTLAAAIASLGASYRTSNFVVNAPTAEMAEQIGRAAERYRKDLAIEWLGREMANWSQPCPITAHVGESLGAGGATSFLFERGEVFGWRMSIQGSLVRILDSVLPHEVTHTVFATHFRQPLPRWADEGACTTVEDYSERAKQQTMLIEFLHTGRGIPFSRMFAMKDYPHDVMPLYSQGYSLASYLIAQGSRKEFLDFLTDGLTDENWTRATAAHYHYSSLSALQNSWLSWVRQGSPAIKSKSQPAAAANTLAKAARRPRPEPNLIYRAQSRDDKSTGDRLSGDRTLAYSNSERSDGPSTYLAPRQDSEREDRSTKSGSASGWHPRNKSLASRDAASVDEVSAGDRVVKTPEPVEHQVTRPQPVQKSRQIILEWNRPQAVAETQ